MAGSPGTRLADPLAGPRAALIIATTKYQDGELRQLRAPAHDAHVLADILAQPGIGAFSVTTVIDADERQVRRAIAAFLSDRGVGDVVVVYLSCHGVLDRRNRLYFAATDTIKAQLSATGIASEWLLDQLEECRARQQVLILDCCFSGAFVHGSKGDVDLAVERRLVGQGRGRAVLTASRASEYSFEGQALPGTRVSGSVFTGGLVEGLRTGAADVGGDGYVSVDEAYDYAFSYVRDSGASQTPQRWLSGGEGAIVRARSPAGIAISPAASPGDLTARALQLLQEQLQAESPENLAARVLQLLQEQLGAELPEDWVARVLQLLQEQLGVPELQLYVEWHGPVAQERQQLTDGAALERTVEAYSDVYLSLLNSGDRAVTTLQSLSPVTLIRR
jgi:Caspase domain